MKNWKSNLSLVLIAFLIASGSVLTMPIQNQHSYGIDFLHFWSIGELAVNSRASSESQPVSSSVRESKANVFVYDEAYHPEMIRRIQSWDSTSQRVEQLLEQHQSLYRSGLNPTATPFLYASFYLFMSGDFEVDLYRYQIVSNTFLLMGLTLFASCCFQIRAFAGRCALLGSFALLLLFWQPFLIDWRVGNVSRLQTAGALVALTIGLKTVSVVDGKPMMRGLNRYRVIIVWVCTGLLWGALIAMKPNIVLAPALMVGFFILCHYWCEAVSILAGLALGLLITMVPSQLLLGHSATWWDWWQYIRQTLNAPFPINEGNYALVSLLPMGIAGWFSPLAMASVGGTLVVYHAKIWYRLSWRAGENGIKNENEQARLPDSKGDAYVRAALVGACGLVLPLMFAPIAWAHYFSLSVPLLMLLICGRKWATPSRVVIGITAVMLSGLPMVYLPAAWGVWIAAMFFVSLVSLVVLAFRTRHSQWPACPK